MTQVLSFKFLRSAVSAFVDISKLGTRCFTSRKTGIIDDSADDLTAKLDCEFQQQHYREIFDCLSKKWRLSNTEQNVFVIQPDYKYKMKKNFLTNVKYQLEESVALVETLPQWRVVDKSVCSVKYQKSSFFGPGQLSALVKRVQQIPNSSSPSAMDQQANKKISVVFISVNMLTGSQMSRLRRIFRCDVYDRYALVLEIFRRHATSAEAKLQVSLAEGPYVRARIGEIIRAKSMDQLGGGLNTVCGPGETLTEQLKRFLHQRESHIIEQLKRVEAQRSTLRSARQRRELPSIAIVGYTNAGKTSLARLLSGDHSRLMPNSRLFATLDVTAHGAKLPCGLKVVYLDTVGFLSDLPTQLVAAFRSTLEDVKLADLVLHVVDLSNPDWPHQRQEVLETLAALQLPQSLMDSIIEVGNKADAFDCDIDSLSVLAGQKTICVSARAGTGLSRLVEAIEARVLANTGRRVVRLRIPTAGPHLAWLHHEQAFIGIREVSTDGESLTVDALFTEASHGRFRAQFGSPSSRNSSRIVDEDDKCSGHKDDVR